MNTLIVGVGNIGSRIYEEFKPIKPDRYDPAKGFEEKRDITYDVAFICVDTPMNEDGSCDLRQVVRAIQDTKADVIALRSTVPPGTTDDLAERYARDIVFYPEFYGTTQHADHTKFSFDFTILGGDKKACRKVVQVLQGVYDARHRFNITDAKTAELAKYMENTFLAARVSLCVQFWKIAKQFGIDYPELREIWLNDVRFNRAHTFVYDEKPYWESHCFDKDLLALTRFAHAPLVESIIKFNEECKKEYKK